MSQIIEDGLAASRALESGLTSVPNSEQIGTKQHIKEIPKYNPVNEEWHQALDAFLESGSADAVNMVKAALDQYKPRRRKGQR